MDGVTDALRLVAALSIVVAGLLSGWSGALVFVVVSAAMWVPRIAALPRVVDLAIGITWLVAGWANAAHLYVAASWVDIPVHATMRVLARLLSTCCSFVFSWFLRWWIGRCADAHSS